MKKTRRTKRNGATEAERGLTKTEAELKVVTIVEAHYAASLKWHTGVFGITAADVCAEAGFNARPALARLERRGELKYMVLDVVHSNRAGFRTKVKTKFYRPLFESERKEMGR